VGWAEEMALPRPLKLIIHLPLNGLRLNDFNKRLYLRRPHDVRLERRGGSRSA